MKQAIAVVGMACRYADASSPRELWENVLTERRAFRRIPNERLSLDDYYSTVRSEVDKITVKNAAVIKNYTFDRVHYRVAGNTYRVTDHTHWLALDVAAQALQDAGFPDGNGLNTKTTGVLVGNTLTGEFSRAGLLRLRWPYVHRVIDAQLNSKGWDKEERRDFLADLETTFKSPFPTPNEESLAGGLSNTIAGRLCNYFNLQGGGYSLDGACSSSLIAVSNACAALQSNDLDVALVGGVDLSLDPFELVGFSRTGALAQNQMRVYDQSPTGFLPGEGCGFIVLMRQEDAIAQGLRSYALLRGWGISSDGAGGITRPEMSGQRLALHKAYQRAGYGIDTVPLFEGHGTGTAVGDEVELGSLIAEINEKKTGHSHDNHGPATIGSIKPLIGHTKAAAGIAGLIKMVMALQTQIIPSTSGVQKPRKEIADENAILKISRQSKLWPKSQALRAGVSSFGFGGINVHIALESATSHRRSDISNYEAELLSTAQDQELFLFSNDSYEEFLASINKVNRYVSHLAFSEMTDLAIELSRYTSLSHNYKLAIVAEFPESLTEKFRILLQLMSEGKKDVIDVTNGIFLNTTSRNSKIAFLFPGQAAPIRLQSGTFGTRFPVVAKTYEDAGLSTHGNINTTETAQPALITAELAGLKLLGSLGIHADVSLGHSLGELAALNWAGVIDDKSLIDIAKLRGQLMGNSCDFAGTMVSIGANEKIVSGMLAEYPELTIACYNSPEQTIISGDTHVIETLVINARQQNISATVLPVSNAFHSSHMLAAAKKFELELNNYHFNKPTSEVISTITGKQLNSNTNIVELLVNQLTEPVHFIQAQSSLPDDIDLCIEVGPGNILNGLMSKLSTVPCVSLDIAGSSLSGILMAVGASFCLGKSLNHKSFFQRRFHRPFNLDWQANFFENPCESAPKMDNQATDIRETHSLIRKQQAVLIKASELESYTPELESSAKDTSDLVRQLVAAKLELPLEAVKLDSRLLIDLHLNSITVSEIVASVANKLNMPTPVAITDFSNATVEEIAQVFDEIKEQGIDQSKNQNGIISGVDEWVRPFRVELVEKPISTVKSIEQDASNWRVFGPDSHPLKNIVSQALSSTLTSGVLVCFPADPSEEDIQWLVESTHFVLDLKNRFDIFVLIQNNNGAASVARTLFLENNRLNVSVIDVPFEERSVEWIMNEITVASGYREVYYDNLGCRREPRLALLEPDKTEKKYPLNQDDVLLVSGGGKGIAAECALELAKNTGASLAILGRSIPENDTELAHNLDRFNQHNIKFHYVSADVNNVQEIESAVSLFQKVLGSVTGILHGAGINKPRRLKDLDEEIFRTTLATKLQGAKNLVSAVDPDSLKLLITFSSIIARTGMQGEADYALANEWLSSYTEDFQKKHPACKCLALEWSIWSGVGMGERLGRVDALQRQGIMPISIDQGVKIFTELVSSSSDATTLVVSGRVNDIPTLTSEKMTLPFLRFLETSKIYYPNIELVVDSEMSKGSDPYIIDHVYKNEALFPAVLGMEAMAQVAKALTARKSVPNFEQLEFLQPIVIPPQETITLRLAALTRGLDTVDVVVRTSTTQFHVDHFRGTCRFANKKTIFDNDIEIPDEMIELDPETDIYGGLLFHTGRFKRILGYRSLSAKQCIVDIQSDKYGKWFSSFLPNELILGDPGFRDAAIHAIQACIPHAQLLPVAIEKIVFADMTLSGPFIVIAEEQSQDDNEFIYNLEIRDSQKQLREKWTGLKLRKVANIEHKNWSEALLLTYIERRVNELIPNSNITLILRSSNIDSRKTRSDNAIRQLIEESANIMRRPDGKPVTNSVQQVSASHSESLTMAVASKDIVSCDLETVFMQVEKVKTTLIGIDGEILAKLIAKSTQETEILSATRIWCAKECLKKVGASINAPLVMLSNHGDGWVLLASGKLKIVSFIAKLKNKSKPTCFSILIED